MLQNTSGSFECVDGCCLCEAFLVRETTGDQRIIAIIPSATDNGFNGIENERECRDNGKLMASACTMLAQCRGLLLAVDERRNMSDAIAAIREIVERLDA